MMPIKIAVAGLGSVAQRGVLPQLAQPDIRDRVVLQAVMDTVSDRAKASKEKFGAEEWYDDYDEMLDKADIDAVTISSPIPFHYVQTLKAVKAGVHVHCNKPITMTTEEADEIVEASEKNNIVVVASPGNSPISANTVRIRELIKEDYLGEIYFGEISGGWPHEYEAFRQKDDVLSDVDPRWYYSTEGPPLTVSSNTVYQLHQIVSLLGSVKRVTGFSGVVTKERTLLRPGASNWKGSKVTVVNDDNTLLVCDFGNSVFAYVSGSLSVREKFPTFFLSGSKGCVIENPWGPNKGLEI
jgi:predicted dehydrogenase